MPVPAPNGDAIGHLPTFPNPDIPTKQSPFSSDPFTDVLEMIFIYCARDYHTSHSGHPTRAPPNWVNVSYVSRHWRNIALNSPTLWSYLFATSPRWLEELLARSKHAPLKIRFHAVEEETNGLWFINQVLDHLERIRELRIEIPYTYKVSEVEPLISKLSSRAPCLQEMALMFVDCWPRRADILFGGDTPVFHTLELSHCSASWQSLDLTCLTTLRLHLIPEAFERSIPELLKTLKYRQNLDIPADLNGLAVEKTRAWIAMALIVPPAGVGSYLVRAGIYGTVLLEGETGFPLRFCGIVSRDVSCPEVDGRCRVRIGWVGEEYTRQTRKRYSSGEFTESLANYTCATPGVRVGSE